MAVLYLDVDDEITSAAARIRALDDDRVAVVLPFGSRLATSRINFRLLAHEATSHGKTIEVIAADASARALAMTAGLTVHPSVAAFESGGQAAAGPAAIGSDEAARTGVVVVPPRTVVPTDAAAAEAGTQTILIPRSRRDPVPVVGRLKPPVRPAVAIGIGVAILAFVVVGGFLALTQLPSATIVLSPWSRELGPQQLSVVADPAVTVADPATLSVPAQRLTFPLTIQQSFTATGVKVTDVNATGIVQFANFDNGGGVFIPKGTIVQTDSKIQFRTTAALTLPRAQQDFFPPFSTHPSTGTVAIEAVEAGVGGNVGANTITHIPKAGNNLRVTNPDATTGGAHNEATVISQQDVDSALAALDAALPAELDRQIAGAVIPSGTTLYPETKAVVASTPSVDPATLVGLAQAQFDLGVTAEGSILGVDSAPIQVLAQARLQGAVEVGWQLQAGSTQVQVGAPVVEGERVTFPVSISAREVRHVDQVGLLAAIRGLNIPAARSKLGDVGSVDLRVWPDWVTTIPTNADRVTLTIADPVPEPTPTP
jgi:hypothetical protein